MQASDSAAGVPYCRLGAEMTDVASTVFPISDFSRPSHSNPSCRAIACPHLDSTRQRAAVPNRGACVKVKTQGLAKSQGLSAGERPWVFGVDVDLQKASFQAVVRVPFANHGLKGCRQAIARQEYRNAHSCAEVTDVARTGLATRPRSATTRTDTFNPFPSRTPCAG